jgi:putative transposase
MTRLTHRLCTFKPLVCLLPLLCDGLCFLCLRPIPTLAAEHLFLRKQLALYQGRQVKPHRPTQATRMVLTWLAQWFDWRQALAVVQPATLIRWHREGFRLFWRWKSAPGRPPIPPGLQALICRMASENAMGGEERIAHELLLKLGPRVSPRTVRKYRPKCFDRGRNHGLPSQRWRTFVPHHAQAVVACDFCVVVTVTLRLLYVFVVMEHLTRRILHVNVTAYPTAPWTMQQLREAVTGEHPYRLLTHDRDTIFSQTLDQSVRHLWLRVLNTPPRGPQANALCERLLENLRRECLDFLIPRTEHHLRRLLQEWVCYDNAGRSHMALGPGIPQPPPHLPLPLQEHRHRLPEPLQVAARPIVGGLHHEYQLTEKAA